MQRRIDVGPVKAITLAVVARTIMSGSVTIGQLVVLGSA
jgi:UDP-3-O-[3-hydroxymyristoyl] glucosamine N-acyltransferase